MRRSSPVFKATHFGRWKESRPADGAWVVDLPADHPKAMRCLLALSHARFHLVPHDCDDNIRSLVDILEIAEKYQMMSVLRPCKNSMKGIIHHEPDHHTNTDPCSIDHVKAIRAAWLLGMEGILSQHLWALVLSGIPSEVTEFQGMGLTCPCVKPASATAELREAGLEELEGMETPKQLKFLSRRAGLTLIQPSRDCDFDSRQRSRTDL